MSTRIRSNLPQHQDRPSYSTESAEVFGADLTHDQRLQIFGGNLRRMATTIFRQKAITCKRPNPPPA